MVLLYICLYVIYAFSIYNKQRCSSWLILEGSTLSGSIKLGSLSQQWEMNNSKLTFVDYLVVITFYLGCIIIAALTIAYVTYPIDVEVEGFIKLFGIKIAYNTSTDAKLGIIKRLVEMIPIVILFTSFTYGIVQNIVNNSFQKEQSTLDRINANWSIYTTAVQMVKLRVSEGNTKPRNFGVADMLTYFSAVRYSYEQSTMDLELCYMSLKNGVFTGLDFSGSNFIGSDFSHSECDDVNFCGADLTGCNFKNANLDNSDFRGQL
jgi:Pentapeptide repeats (8 copies)